MFHFSLPTSGRFTFHYVSIKSKSDFDDDLFVKLFTFHYVSIKSSLRLYPIHSHPDLHSTMFLLNLQTSQRKTPRETYLHSTMFLLNRFGIKQGLGCIFIYIPLCFY